MAGALDDRQRLAGEHALVDAALARVHDPVDRQALAGAHQHDVAPGDLGHRYLHVVLAALRRRPEDAHRRRLQGGEAAERVRGARTVSDGAVARGRAGRPTPSTRTVHALRYVLLFRRTPAAPLPRGAMPCTVVVDAKVAPVPSPSAPRRRPVGRPAAR
jgi:hypothetical protein